MLKDEIEYIIDALKNDGVVKIWDRNPHSGLGLLVLTQHTKWVKFYDPYINWTPECEIPFTGVPVKRIRFTGVLVKRISYHKRKGRLERIVRNILRNVLYDLADYLMRQEYGVHRGWLWKKFKAEIRGALDKMRTMCFGIVELIDKVGSKKPTEFPPKEGWWSVIKKKILGRRWKPEWILATDVESIMTLDDLVAFLGRYNIFDVASVVVPRGEYAGYWKGAEWADEVERRRYFRRLGEMEWKLPVPADLAKCLLKPALPSLEESPAKQNKGGKDEK